MFCKMFARTQAHKTLTAMQNNNQAGQPSQQPQKNIFAERLGILFSAEVNQLITDEASKVEARPIGDYLTHSYDEVKQQAVLFGINGAPVFHRGDVSTIQGQVKSGKSAFAAWLAGAMLNPDGIGFTIEGAFMECEQQPRVLYFDTEQSQYYAHQHIKQINEVAGAPAGIDAPGLYYITAREFTTIEKVVLLERCIRDLRPDVVFLDGVSDLMQDTNSNPEASAICSALMKLATLYDCHICSVIHQNYNSDKARGHIGSELWRKCESVIQVRKEEGPDGTERFVADFPITRGKQVQPLTFVRDDNGTPHAQVVKDMQLYRAALLQQFGAEPFSKTEAAATLAASFPGARLPSVADICSRLCKVERVGHQHKIMYKIE